MKSRTPKLLITLSTVLLVVAACISNAFAAGGCTQPQLPNVPNLGAFSTELHWTNATYTTAGVGLRNRRSGGIEVSGFPAVAPTVAYIYWAVLTRGGAMNTNRILVQRLAPLAPASAVQTVTANATWIGNVPCEWLNPPNGPDRIMVYRGTLDPAVATGNGLYKVYPPTGTMGNFRGEDPWSILNPAPPMWEGASIVMIAQGPQYPENVALYDGMAGNTFSAGTGITYSLVLPNGAVTAGPILFDEIGADGQHGGAARNAALATSSERTFVNTVQAAGPGSPYNDSDWNGSTATPVTELWDDAGHLVSLNLATPALQIQIDNGGPAGGDCLTTVANVVQYP